MRITWLNEAHLSVVNAEPGIRAQIESELPVMFSDAIPGEAVTTASGVMMVELPCGVEIDFERIGDGVRIVYAAFPDGRRAVHEGA